MVAFLLKISPIQSDLEHYRMADSMLCFHNGKVRMFRKICIFCKERNVIYLVFYEVIASNSVDRNVVWS